MRAGTLSRFRAFRADPALDAAMTLAAERRGLPVSVVVRDALRVAFLDTPRPASSARPEARA